MLQATAPRETATDAQGVIERLFDQPRDFRLVREGEGGIELGFERELAQEAVAEGVDRADRDVAEAVTEGEPARPLAERRCNTNPASAITSLLRLLPVRYRSVAIRRSARRTSGR